MVSASARSSFRAQLWAALVGCGMAFAGLPDLSAQSLTIGYQPLTDAGNLSAGFSGGFANGTAYVIPFDFTSLGNYSVSSVSLLLDGNASLNDVSVSISSTLPTNLGSETSLAAFSSTGTLNGTPAAYVFNAGSTPVLTDGTTYYLQLAYTGSATANWIVTTTADPSGGSTFTGSGGIPPLGPIGSMLVPGDDLTFRTLTSGGSFDNFQQVGGFSITADTMSAVPEPAAYGAIAGAAALLAGLIVRRRRVSDAPARSGG